MCLVGEPAVGRRLPQGVVAFHLQAVLVVDQRDQIVVALAFLVELLEVDRVQEYDDPYQADYCEF